MSSGGEPPFHDDDGPGPDEPADDADIEDDIEDDNLIVLPGLGRRDQETDESDEPDDGFAPEGPLGPPPAHMLDGAVEALLLAADGPVTTAQLETWLQTPPQGAVLDCLYDLRARLAQASGGFRLVEVAKGWQLRTEVRFAPWIAAMRGARPLKLSKAALEVLAVVAYRQPVTRSEIDDLRGVDSGGVLRMLAERGVVVITGRRDEPGRPLIYGTNNDFLSLFGLRDLSDLPTLRDLRELQRDDDREGVGDTDDDALWGSHGPRGGDPVAYPTPHQEPLPLPSARPELPTFGLPEPPPEPLVGLPLPPDPDEP